MNHVVCTLLDMAYFVQIMFVRFIQILMCCSLLVLIAVSILHFIYSFLLMGIWEVGDYYG